MNLKLSLVALALTTALFGCNSNNDNKNETTVADTKTTEQVEAQPVAENTMTAEEASQALNQLFTDNFQAGLKLNPIQATAIGIPGYNDQLPNFLSPEYRKLSHDFTVEWLDKIKQIDRNLLTGQDRLSYDIFIYQSEQSLEGEQFPGELIPINQSSNIANFFAQLGSGQSLQPFKTVEDYDNWLKRADGGAAIMEQVIINMNQGIEQNVVQPKALMQKVLPQLEAHVVEDPTKSIFYKPIENMPEDFSAEDKKRLTDAYTQAIVTKLVPSYKKLHDFIKNDYMQHARESFGLSEHPNGKEWYNFQLKTFTTTELTADEIHQFGLDEVARIRGEMEDVMKQVGFEGNLADWFEYVQTNPEFYYDNEEELLQGYRDLQEKVNKLLPSMFDIQPKSDYEVRAVEAFRAESAAGASYMSGTPDGSRPGIFYVNTFNLKGQPKFGMETLSIHEAAPGHHFQISLQQEVEGLPMFRRFGGLSVFSEGWALYAESIGKEMGMFTDPMQYYGRLSDEMLRAMRLVVDTGLHAKGWSRQKAIDYMMENSSMADTDVVSEVERYIAWPGQAVSYKVGQREISNLRADAEKRLGDKFDIKDFHTQILIDGALPMPVLRTKIDEWVKSKI
ncbi:MAG: DUF885 domain-containing protein [Kangiellaceae bacterium]|nr:DUF885 domain-containing protein [Kangiellaceae bacterium]